MGISEHDRRPKEAIERERREKERKEKEEREAYIKVCLGKVPEKLPWHQYCAIVDKQRQMGDGSAYPLFKREPYIEPLLSLARQMRYDVIFDKPNFNRYMKPLGPSDVNVEFDGTKSNFKQIQ